MPDADQPILLQQPCLADRKDAMKQRISHNALVQAIATVRAMDMKQRAQLADELLHQQPHMFASFLVQKRLGASLTKMDFLLDILFICFQAMKESGLSWPLITEEELDRQMKNYLNHIKFDETLVSNLSDSCMRKYIAGHPEKELLAHVQTETVNWLNRIAPEESDKYIVIAAATYVNCIAFVPLPESAAARA